MSFALILMEKAKAIESCDKLDDHDLIIGGIAPPLDVGRTIE